MSYIEQFGLIPPNVNEVEVEVITESVFVSNIPVVANITVLGGSLKSYLLKAGKNYEPLRCNNLRYMRYLVDQINSGQYPRTITTCSAVGYYIMNYLEEKLERQLNESEVREIDYFIAKIYKSPHTTIPSLLNRYKIVDYIGEDTTDNYTFLYQAIFRGMDGNKYIVAIDTYMIALKVTKVTPSGTKSTYILRANTEVSNENKTFMELCFPDPKQPPNMKLYADTLICELWNVERLFCTRVSDDEVYVTNCNLREEFISSLEHSPLREHEDSKINNYSKSINISRVFYHSEYNYLVEIGIREDDYVLTLWTCSLNKDVATEQWILPYTTTLESAIDIIKSHLLGNILNKIC